MRHDRVIENNSKDGREAKASKKECVNFHAEVSAVHLPSKRREYRLLSAFTGPGNADPDRVKHRILHNVRHAKGQTQLKDQHDHVDGFEPYHLHHEHPDQARDGRNQEANLGDIGQIDIILIHRGSVRFEGNLHKESVRHREHDHGPNVPEGAITERLFQGEFRQVGLEKDAILAQRR